jgi:hypothetical protein
MELRELQDSSWWWHVRIMPGAPPSLKQKATTMDAFWFVIERVFEAWHGRLAHVIST